MKQKKLPINRVSFLAAKKRNPPQPLEALKPWRKSHWLWVEQQPRELQRTKLQLSFTRRRKPEKTFPPCCFLSFFFFARVGTSPASSLLAVSCVEQDSSRSRPLPEIVLFQVAILELWARACKLLYAFDSQDFGFQHRTAVHDLSQRDRLSPQKSLEPRRKSSTTPRPGRTIDTWESIISCTPQEDVQKRD